MTSLHPLPVVSRALLSLAVLAPVVVAVIVVTNGPAPTGTASNQALGVSVLVGLVAVLVCLGLALTDHGLQHRRERWVAGFLLTTTIAAALYLWTWHWRRPTRKPATTTLARSR